MTLVYAIHSEWHICKSISLCLQYVPLCKRHACKSRPLWLQCMPPTASDIYAKAYYHHDSSICHRQRVAYMQEHTIVSLVRATHDKWHVCRSTTPQTQVRQFPSWFSKGLAKPKVRPWWVLLIHTIMSPIDATLYARAHHYDSNTCHSWWVPCMQEHNTYDSTNLSSALGNPHRFTKSKARP